MLRSDYLLVSVSDDETCEDTQVTNKGGEEKHTEK